MKIISNKNIEKHDIVLINPPLLEYPVILTPLGISYVKSYCEKMSNYKVFCIDLAIHFLNTLNLKIVYINNVFNKYKGFFEVLITSNGFVGEFNLNLIPDILNRIKNQNGSYPKSSTYCWT